MTVYRLQNRTALKPPGPPAGRLHPDADLVGERQSSPPLSLNVLSIVRFNSCSIGIQFSIPLINTRSSKLRLLSPKPLNTASGAGLERTRGFFRAACKEQFFGQFGIGAVNDSNRYPNPDIFIRKRPVDQAADNKLFIGDDQLLAIPVDDSRRPDTDLRYGSVDIADGDRITDDERPLEQDDQSADKSLPQFPATRNPRPTPRAAISHCKLAHLIPIVLKTIMIPTTVIAYRQTAE